MVIVSGMNTGLIPQWQYAAEHPAPVMPMEPEQLQLHMSKLGFRTGDQIKDLNGPRLGSIFDKLELSAWAWNNRKWLVIGGGILAALGAASIFRSL